MVRSLRVVVLLSVLVAGTPGVGVAQNTDPPEAVKEVIEVVNDVKLGIEGVGGVQYRSKEVLPLKNRPFRYLQRPVSGDLPFVMPYYGVGLSLRYRGAEVAFRYEDGSGVQSRHWVTFRDGAKAVPFTPDYRAWSLRARSFFLDWVGVGEAIREETLGHHSAPPSKWTGGPSTASCSVGAPI